MLLKVLFLSSLSGQVMRIKKFIKDIVLICHKILRTDKKKYSDVKFLGWKLMDEPLNNSVLLYCRYTWQFNVHMF